MFNSSIRQRALYRGAAARWYHPWAVNSPLRRWIAAAILLATPWTAVRAGDGEPQPASGAPTLLILVRHAEKTAGDPDPSLSPAGQDRARALAHTLGDLEIDALYSSQFRRTRLTLEPLSRRTGLAIETAEISREVGAWAKAFATRLLDRHRGRIVVVAGHSNTVPLLARALGATGVPELTEADYDDMFWILRSGEGVEFMHLHYGEMSE